MARNQFETGLLLSLLFVNLAFSASPSEKQHTSLEDLEIECAQLERKAHREFEKEKKQANRNLKSLQSPVSSRESDLKKAKTKYTKKIKQIQAQCLKKKHQILKSFEEPQNEVSPLPIVQPEKKKETPVEKLEIPLQKEEMEATPLLNKLNVSGRLTQEVAYRIAEPPHELTKNRSMLALEHSRQINENIKVRLSGLGFFDSVVQHNNQRKEQNPAYAEDDLESEVQLRDAFIDISHADWDFRIGNQQIVWGEALNVFVADVVNAKDFREFILPEFDFIRRHQFSAVNSITRGDLHIDGILSIPRFNKLPTENSEFAVPFSTFSAQRPGQTINNLDVGGRASYLFGSLDLGVFFLHTWEKSPILIRRFSGTGFSLSPEYRRQDIFGLTFSQEILETIFKGELAIHPDSPFLTTDPTDPDGFEKKTVYDAMLGWDKTFFGSLDTNFQINQRVISDSDQFIIEDDHRTYFSFRVQKDFRDGTIKPEYTIISNTQQKDRLHRLKMAFLVNDSVTLKIGADIFEGSKGLFGQFGRKDRSTVELSYSF